MPGKNELRRWIDEASKEDLEWLAVAADTTVGTLRHIAGGYRAPGSVSAGLASRIERATKVLEEQGLAHVPRGALCAACAGCDLYKKARAKK